MSGICGPAIASAWRLLGVVRQRRTFLGRLVLEVQEGRRHGYAMGTERCTPAYDEWIEMRWRKATIYDMRTPSGVEPLDESALLPPVQARPWPHERRAG